MLGLEGAGVFAAYVLSVLAALVCIVYGYLNWNKPKDEDEAKEIAEELEWEQHEPEAMERSGGAQ